MTLPPVYRPKGDLKIQKLRYAEQTGGRVTLTKPTHQLIAEGCPQQSFENPVQSSIDIFFETALRPEQVVG